MVQTLKATKVTLGDLAEQFSLTQTSDPRFFQEWQAASEEVSTAETFTDEMLTRLHEILVELLSKWDCKLVEFNGEADHVHLLFQYHPDLQLSTLVNNVKSITSRKLRQEFSEHLSKIYCQDVFWNGSYFIASCCDVTITTLKQYIENQG